MAFQVVEHWAPEGIFRFLQLARRALAPGGVLIAETINVDSLSALRAFYLDPTHVRPVPPDALRFLAEAAGFTDARIEYRSPLPAAEPPRRGGRRRPEAQRPALRAAGLRPDRPRAGRALRPRRVLVLATQTPFADGGAERHVRRLTEELKKRGVEADLVSMPLVERERFDLVRGALGWRSLDLTETAGGPVDAVIATRFPTYAIRHPRKVVWLIHQYRQAYDQYGTPYSDLTSSPEDRRTREVIARIDQVGLSEARKVFANSQTVAARLRRFNGIASEPLYHPPPLAGRYRNAPLGDTVLWVGRLDEWKRPALLLAGAAARARGARGLRRPRSRGGEAAQARGRAGRGRARAVCGPGRRRGAARRSTPRPASSPSPPRAKTSATCRSRRFCRERRS